MSRQSTLDAHLSPVTPKKRPRRLPLAPSGSSSDGERGLSAIKLSAAPTHPRLEELTTSERRRMKQRAMDREDHSDQSDGEQRARRKMRAQRGNGDDPDAGEISVRLADEEWESDEQLEIMEGCEKEVNSSLGIRNRPASKSRSPFTSSQAYFIPSDSEEPIVLSSQAHMRTQVTKEGALQELQMAAKARLNGTHAETGVLQPVLAPKDAQDPPVAARRVVDALETASVDNQSPVAFNPRKRALQRIESVEVVSPFGFDKKAYAPTLKLGTSAQATRAGHSASKTATPTPAPPDGNRQVGKAQAQRTVGKSVRLAETDLEDDDLDWAVEAAHSQAPAEAHREGTYYSDGGLADNLLASMDPAVEEAAAHAEIRSPPQVPVKRAKRVPPESYAKSEASATSSEDELSLRPRASTKAGPSRLPVTAKAKVTALAERRRAQRASKESTTRVWDDFIVDDGETSEDGASQPRNQSKPALRGPSKSKVKRRQDPSDDEAIRRRNLKSLRKQARKIRDPDEDVNEAAESEAEDMVKEVELDEADRFKSASRLRKRKETAFQRALRKRNNLRKGINESTTESEIEIIQDNAPIVVSDDSWIEDVGEDFDDSLMPQQFSNNSTQTPEFVFKVVFQYMLLLVIAGPECLPLKPANEEYFIPRLNYMRRKLSGIQTSVVQSQIWRPDFVMAMQTFPHLRSSYMDELYDGCDACHMSGRMSRFEAVLDGRRYNPVTYEDLSDHDESRGSDSEESSSGDDLPRQFKLGRMCHARTRVFHQFCHWEYDLHRQIKLIYDDIKRAKGRTVSEFETEEDSELSEEEQRERRRSRAKDKRRQQQRANQLKAKRLPSDIGDLNEVLQWFEDKGHVGTLFVANEQLVESAHKLENMRSSRDDE